MNIFQIISIEWWIVTLLILAYAFFNEHLVEIEHKIASGLRQAFERRNVNNE